MRALLAAGVVLLVGGFAVGLAPVHAGPGVPCGAALSSGHTRTATDDADAIEAGVDPVALDALDASCASARRPNRAASLVLLVLGAALLAGAAAAGTGRREVAVQASDELGR